MANNNNQPIPLANNPNNINNNEDNDNESVDLDQSIPYESDIDDEYEYDPVATDRTRRGEYHAFGWRCILCNIVASSPLGCDMQFNDNHGPYSDMDDTLWIKCAKCCTAFHLHCLGLTAQTVVVPFLCPIFGCAEGTEQDPAHVHQQL